MILYLFKVNFLKDLLGSKKAHLDEILQNFKFQFRFVILNYSLDRECFKSMKKLTIMT